MKTRRTTKVFFLLLAGLLLVAGVTGYAQDGTQAAQSTSDQQSAPAIVKVTSGQELTVEGLIVKRAADTFTMEDARGSFYVVTLKSNTELRERKSNPFRSAKTYGAADLLRGLTVEVKGRGDSSGSLQADKIRLRKDDLRVAESLQAGINPVEQQLKQAETRLAQA
ncbi:MAG TPA: DUF5666 domain-containing protein, partial [Acidobacteriota bacterium]|nr:DUF5666 domain-containing protein [Acidobacteriota bacterium]